MRYLTEHRSGLLATILTHGAILAILISFGIVSTVPMPPDEGILVNFGDSETGFGNEEPAPGEREPAAKPIESSSEKQVLPKSSPKVATAADDDISTQDMEETLRIKSVEKKKKPEKTIDPEQKRLEDEARAEQAELARQKKEQEQLLAQAAAEQRKS